ncbi:EAL and modified HD-GYP domain-containing signal transduction protein [Noviherbaspirillum humi]|uniref:EAL and modified HD-GYP domain-containing signal transduction protein n=1 Tax=Noviherbaspirillum humi TaxID=1688639 RepID=A0A239D6C9_9BURK|nr:EAL domain-containing protein [Noviherbaspirillum humi]SNS27900.1 EAL and modified HD-GYP domain-containing signal transduction protein [Noviherbaspirillum humi]
MDDLIRKTLEKPIAPAPRLREFFLARQPILNRDQTLAAYELLFRAAAEGPANVVDHLSATAAVITHAAELGIENVLGGSVAFLNVDAAMLMSDAIRLLPRQRVVLEILETVKATDAVLARVDALRKEGYTIALDDVIAASADVQRLLPLADIIKLDLGGADMEQVAALSRRFKQEGKKLLAEKVESMEQFERCLELGCDYFQGYYFARPLVLTGKRLSPSQMTIMQLMQQIAAGASMDEIERTIKQDASMGLMLMRLLNSASDHERRRIRSLGQALRRISPGQLGRWLQILLYAEASSAGGPSPLLNLATTRGRLLELIAARADPANAPVADTAFTVGIMSLMDVLFSLPMEAIVERMSVSAEIAGALLRREGRYGDMLLLAELIERDEAAACEALPLLHKLGLSLDDFRLLQLHAFDWSDRISGCSMAEPATGEV